MNIEDYNQITINKNAIENPDLMKEGEIVTVIINLKMKCHFQ